MVCVCVPRFHRTRRCGCRGRGGVGGVVSVYILRGRWVGGWMGGWMDGSVCSALSRNSAVRLQGQGVGPSRF